MVDITGFFKKGGIKWPFKPKTPPSSSFSIGPYSLDMQIVGLSGLREFSAIEYRAFTRQYKGERIYHGPEVDLLGYSWKLIITAVNGKVYKIAAYIETKDKDLAHGAAMKTFSYCKQQIGEPDKQRSGMFIWDTLDGDVALKTTQIEGGFEINLLLTSNATRHFSQLG
jgi:hypothetical protein